MDFFEADEKGQVEDPEEWDWAGGLCGGVKAKSGQYIVNGCYSERSQFLQITHTDTYSSVRDVKECIPDS